MKMKKQSKSTYWHVVIGVIQAMILSVLSAALGAVLIDNETITVNSVPMLTFIIWFLSSFLGALFAGFSGEGKWAARSVVAVGIYYIILLSVGSFLLGDLTTNVGYGFVAVVMGFALAIFLLSKKQKRFAKRKIRNFMPR